MKANAINNQNTEPNFPQAVGGTSRSTLQVTDGARSTLPVQDKAGGSVVSNFLYDVNKGGSSKSGSNKSDTSAADGIDE